MEWDGNALEIPALVSGNIQMLDPDLAVCGCVLPRGDLAAKNVPCLGQRGAGL